MGGDRPLLTATHHPPAVDLSVQGHLALETGDDFAGVKGEGPDTVTSADGVQVHGNTAETVVEADDTIIVTGRTRATECFSELQ
ncbi:hypothetical protein SROCM77S_06142 [Streptomyces rochei]|nr:hypothetical protein K5X85_00970 [Streptomyces sp. A144]GGZ86511.1 hypothetical protein GCM10010301_69040 [Streptomyces plicatus]